jgi:uncharacterized HhH-GPD family protein
LRDRVPANCVIDRAEVLDVRPLEPFSFRWPDADEYFESGWAYRILVDGESHQVRHGVGGREVYGRYRVHAVTWLDNQVQVEGVEADDYPSTRALISGLRRPDKGLVHIIDEVPAGYHGFDLVEHRREIEAKWSRHSLAVKIREDDLAAWGLHAWLRMRSRTSRPSEPAAIPAAKAPSPLPPAPVSVERRAVATALLAHGRALASALGGAAVRLTANDEANALVHDDPFAYLIAVICDQGIVAERAWAIPYDLKQRLGHLDPARMAGSPDAVRAAFDLTPKLHRFVNNIADWVWRASDIVVDRYGGDASRIWSNEPSAAELRARFDAFPGIGQKKAAMAVEILERDLHVKLTDLSGSDIAYDVHVRRVFLRTGLAERDDVEHMVAVARSIHPERPGELDNPAWDIGRRWCRPSEPDCPSCPLLIACPRLIERGNAVRGV